MVARTVTTASAEPNALPVTARQAALIAGILLIAVNLRSSLTVVGPLLNTMSSNFSLSLT